MKLHVKEVAEAKGIKSAKALSIAAGIPYASVHRIWNGSVTMLALDTIERLCKALNVQPGMLLSWIDTENLPGADSTGQTASHRRIPSTMKPRGEKRSKSRSIGAGAGV